MKDDLNLAPPDEVENVVCEDVKPEDMDKIINIYVPQMIGILQNHHGLGLAAPQVGIKKKFFIAQDINNKEKIDLFVNAFYTANGSRIKVREGCLTYDLKNTKEIKRHKGIRFIHEVWDGEKFNKRIDKIKGPQGIIYQHECDHLKGITIFMKG